MPLVPLVIVNHATLLAAVHAQPLAVVTLALALPPAPAIVCEVGEIEKEQVSLSIIVNVAALGVPMVAPPVALVKVRLTVSSPSKMLSSRIVTVKSLLPLSPAFQLSVPAAAV